MDGLLNNIGVYMGSHLWISVGAIMLTIIAYVFGASLWTSRKAKASPPVAKP